MEGGPLDTVRHAWHQIATAAADLIFPLVCVVCDRLLDAGESGVVCGRCWTRVERLPFPHCPRCGHPRSRYSCQWCALLPPYVRSARSVCWMPGGVAGDLVHQLKYHGWPRIADAMAERMARLAWPEDVVAERGLLVPVPLTPQRERERGFNQSARLATALAARWGIPVCHALARNRATESQTRLTPGERQRNVAGAFGVIVPRARLAGQHVVLVDDVITTAATLNACASTLFEGGARIISYVTFGRARAAGDRL